MNEKKAVKHEKTRLIRVNIPDFVAVEPKIITRIKKKVKEINCPELMELAKKLYDDVKMSELVEKLIVLRYNEYFDSLSSELAVMALKKIENKKMKFKSDVRLEIARNLVKNGYDIKNTAMATSLSEAKIKSLAKKPAKKAA